MGKLFEGIGQADFSCAKIQDLADSAGKDVRHILEHGVPPAWEAVASLGTDGAYPNNIERDLHRWLANVRRNSMGFELELYDLPLH